jgi:dipeptidyl aminopeptidase/acylaminoacyl peptidase
MRLGLNSSAHVFPLFCAAVAMLFSGASPAQAQSPAGSRAAAVVDSMPHAKKIDQVAISPDGTQFAYIVEGELTLESLSGGTPHPVSVDGKLLLREVSWSTDSKQITFLADLAGDIPIAQVWTASLDGSAPVKHAELKGYVQTPRFSPDGATIAVLFIEGLPRAAGPLQPMTPLAGVIDDEVYEERLTTINLATNKVSQVTPADVYVYEYDWIPDGTAWAATAAHGSGDANWWVAKLYRIDAQSGDMREIYSPKWQMEEPHVSPDGKSVAILEGLMSDAGITGGDVVVVPLTGGKARNLTPNLHASPASLVWTSSDRILFAENIDGNSGLAAVPATGGSVQQLWKGEEVAAATSGGWGPGGSFSRDGTTTALVRQSAGTPPEVWAGTIGSWKQITHLNSSLQPQWGPMRNVHWKNGDTAVQGWLMLPKDLTPGKTYPLVLTVHGGPSSACTSHWDEGFNGAASSMGYFVLCPNPRGSYGQGEAFTQGNIKDFGGGDYRDIMAGVDAISGEFPIDSRRIGIRGHSYGGYMTMWAETQTQRFAAAVAGAGLSNWLSYYGLNDIDEWMIPFFGASVYDDPAVYAKSDPMHFVKAVKTPTLILVGDRDGEVPMEQSVEWWHALKSLKVPTRLVVYPNEGHLFVKPADARDYTLRSLEWFDEWFAKAPAK